MHVVCTRILIIKKTKCLHCEIKFFQIAAFWVSCLVAERVTWPVLKSWYPESTESILNSTYHTFGLVTSLFCYRKVPDRYGAGLVNIWPKYYILNIKILFHWTCSEPISVLFRICCFCFILKVFGFHCFRNFGLNRRAWLNCVFISWFKLHFESS